MSRVTELEKALTTLFRKGRQMATWLLCNVICRTRIRRLQKTMFLFCPLI